MTYSITAIIPAHNEADIIAKTIHSLQVNGCDNIIVANDNSTDNTYEIAESLGVTVFNTINNTGRKAGALNQALTQYIDHRNSDQYIFIVDADTVINDDWVAHARPLLDNNSFDAVGSIFHADNRSGYLRYMQYLEWERYAFQVSRSQKVFVLTGTASLIRLSKLEAVYALTGHYYDEDGITEDFAMTIDLKNVGTRMISPQSTIAFTETMPSFRLLYLQRRRWYLGALQQVFSRQFSKIMWPYLGQQMMLFITMIAFGLIIIANAYLILTNQYAFSLFWWFILLAFATERLITVWHLGWHARIVAVTLIPELLYTYILQISYLGAWIQFVSGSNGTWNHLD